MTVHREPALDDDAVKARGRKDQPADPRADRGGASAYLLSALGNARVQRLMRSVALRHREVASGRVDDAVAPFAPTGTPTARVSRQEEDEAPTEQSTPEALESEHLTEQSPESAQAETETETGMPSEDNAPGPSEVEGPQAAQAETETETGMPSEDNAPGPSEVEGPQAAQAETETETGMPSEDNAPGPSESIGLPEEEEELAMSPLNRKQVEEVEFA